ncbi:peptide ABC transporter permease [Microbacterium sp. CFBP9034]|uniref:peptide ABC transporter permease n=1 Tax=Microbacterium sp. CFBP9034 TaxID=3096540 RepID=UPI002A6AC63D|nr:peptide ABC transporter permease [Microbacterium sp. CFBP9034]MDY0908512.1 peptide ABC transporter permease [Microbacterium sp. CFBP9034]
MSAPAWSAHPLTSPAVRWDEVEPGFRVGTARDGEYLGYIESTAHGTFVAVDGRSTPVGRYFSLREAQRAVVQVKRMGARSLSASAELTARRLATSSGVLAASLLLSAGALFLKP